MAATSHHAPYHPYGHRRMPSYTAHLLGSVYIDARWPPLRITHRTTPMVTGACQATPSISLAQYAKTTPYAHPCHTPTARHCRYRVYDRRHTRRASLTHTNTTLMMTIPCPHLGITCPVRRHRQVADTYTPLEITSVTAGVCTSYTVHLFGILRLLLYTAASRANDHTNRRPWRGAANRHVPCQVPPPALD